MPPSWRSVKPAESDSSSTHEISPPVKQSRSYEGDSICVGTGARNRDYRSSYPVELTSARQPNGRSSQERDEQADIDVSDHVMLRFRYANVNTG